MDVKSSPVYFYVMMGFDSFNITNTPIPFDQEKLNVGGAMNLNTGKFTAPRDGTYSFSFTGLVHLPATSTKSNVNVWMYLNGNFVGSGWADEVGTIGQYETFSFQSTFNLQTGDEIWLQIDQMSTGTYLFGYQYTHFSGYLLEEKLAVV